MIDFNLFILPFAALILIHQPPSLKMSATRSTERVGKRSTILRWQVQ
jgi:hypothetical protein